jgi:hypothetical protein
MLTKRNRTKSGIKKSNVFQTFLDKKIIDGNLFEL